MRLSLTGMSGSGKSYWSKKLEQEGFKRYCIDDMIEEKLGIELKKLGYSGIADVAKWMGQPYAPQYGQTSKRYLELEIESMHDVFAKLEKQSADLHVVIDTTGSVIYTGEPILKRLKELTRVLYLETPESVKKEMYELYIKDPKPVIWGNSFNKQRRESDLQALSRCYPELLKYRTLQYEKLANITFDYHELRNPSFNLLEKIH